MKKHTFDIVEADDGSGDLVLQLTEEFCKEEDWQTGDIIEWKQEEDSWIMINRTKESRSEG